jgi:hypothetical protein
MNRVVRQAQERQAPVRQDYYFVQIASFTNPTTARTLQQRFIDAGHHAEVLARGTNTNRTYDVQVYVGTTMEQADKARLLLEKKGIPRRLCGAPDELRVSLRYLTRLDVPVFVRDDSHQPIKQRMILAAGFTFNPGIDIHRIGPHGINGRRYVVRAQTAGQDQGQ